MYFLHLFGYNTLFITRRTLLIYLIFSCMNVMNEVPYFRDTNSDVRSKHRNCDVLRPTVRLHSGV
jgi:hypothetical protein